MVSWTFENSEYNQDNPVRAMESNAKKCQKSDQSQLYIDSNDPTRYLSAKDTRTLVRKPVSGFDAHGLDRGDCVCVVSFNDVRSATVFQQSHRCMRTR